MILTPPSNATALLSAILFVLGCICGAQTWYAVALALTMAAWITLAGGVLIKRDHLRLWRWERKAKQLFKRGGLKWKK